MNCMVTGVSRGIGRSTIAELMRQGHSIWGVSHTAVPDLLEEERGRFRHSLCDVGNSEGRKRAAEEMNAAGFWPDAVILNAAVEYEEEKTALSWEKMQEVLRINVEGALFWIFHWMDCHPRRSIQFVGGSFLLALWPDADCPAYSASKAALSMAFRAQRQDGLYRRMISGIYNVLFLFLYPAARVFLDINSKPKVMTRDAYQRIHLVSNDWFTDAEIMIEALRHDLSVGEVSTVFYKNKRRGTFVRFFAIYEFLSNLIYYRFVKKSSSRIRAVAYTRGYPLKDLSQEKIISTLQVLMACFPNKFCKFSESAADYELIQIFEAIYDISVENIKIKK